MIGCGADVGGKLGHAAHSSQPVAVPRGGVSVGGVEHQPDRRFGTGWSGEDGLSAGHAPVADFNRAKSGRDGA